MKFNTITLDANLPTTQQVNVPTNSDYKIGMKVKRNGTVQSIKPSEFTVTDPDGNTLSADPDKTNGYVTITKASGDNASFGQYDVKVDADFTYVVNEYNLVQQGAAGGPYVVMDIDLSHLAGTTITPDQLFLAAQQSKATAPEPPTREQLEALLVPYMDTSLPNMQWAMGGGSRLVNPSGKQIMFYPDTLMKDNFNYFGWKEGDAPIFIANNVGEVPLYPLTSFTIEDGAHLIIHNNNLPANRYAAALFALLPQEAIHADFKLNINEFKSQSGDLAETLADGNYVNVDGIYADGTTFSYDFCIK